jgi:hypothetical protein
LGTSATRRAQSVPGKEVWMMNRMRVHLKWDPTIVMYLVIIDKLIRDKAELVKVRPTEKFFDMVHEQVMDYVLEGKEPPAQIAGAIMNISDDMMAGREVVMRAGDYISLMSFAKAQKRL